MTVPGGNPVTAVPGLSPRSPVTIVRPVFVTVDAARTANDDADPSGTGAVITARGARGAVAVMPGPGTGGMINGGNVKVTNGTVVTGVDPVVKLQTNSKSNAFPARSRAVRSTRAV